METVKEGRDYSFPEEEQQVLQLWDDIDAFHEQLRRSEGKPAYVFYDGPPFATGLPHYGHLLAGTLKVISLWKIPLQLPAPSFRQTCRGLPQVVLLDSYHNFRLFCCRMLSQDMPQQLATTAPDDLGKS